MEVKFIRIVGARQHNLQNVSVDIPRDRLVVLTGLSGSGKSSLAFDTIYAEGQRRYVESLSVHARTLLEQVSKPDVERIEGLPPTLAIQQHAGASNPRSTVATTTELYEFLRLLYARVGTPHCPNCDTRLQRRTVDQIVDDVMQLPAETRLMVLAPLTRHRKADHAEVLRRVQREGFVRARVNGTMVELAELRELPAAKKIEIDAVVDRLQVRPELRRRIAEAVELSLRLADGSVIICHENGRNGNGRTEGAADAAGSNGWVDTVFSERFACTRCGFAMAELSPRLFSFNLPYGACPSCDGLGRVQRFDPDLIVPDPDVPLNAGAIAVWKEPGRKGEPIYMKAVRPLCEAFNVRPNAPFRELPEDLKRILLHGTRPKDRQQYNVKFEGVIPSLERRWKGGAADGASARLTAYMSEHVCETCSGGRLRREALSVKVGERAIHQVTAMTISDALAFFDGLSFEGEAAAIAEPILHEVRQRVRFLHEVGLGYLTLDRGSATLSGGEAQRIRLGTQLGSGLVGVCYVLDEPTIGLHPRDNERLLRSIRRLVDIGNSVIVVEHDEEVIRAADFLIDMGPGAGLHGGRIIAQGTPEEVLKNPQSLTGRYLSGEYTIAPPDERRTPKRSDFIQVIGAREHNLKNISVNFPLGVLCAVTGVSGSGKSTLITQTLVPALKRRLSSSNGAVGSAPGAHERLVGASKIQRVVEVDQTAIGRTPRSNPATYTGVFDEIRNLYAQTKEARIRGYSSSRFSFNAKGGRCEACQGQGVRRIEMHFLPDVFVECGQCKGTRYNRETLDVRYRGRSIADVLAMRVEEALPLFDNFPKIRGGLQALTDVGLGYIELGQPSNTLSGGEAQRVKLAAELANPSTGHTLYVLDEPTTGLHFADIQMLLTVLNRLVALGNTVLVIEHNLDVVAAADWVIDLGPEGGEAGGLLVCEGPPEAIARCDASHTGWFLRKRLSP